MRFLFGRNAWFTNCFLGILFCISSDFTLYIITSIHGFSVSSHCILCEHDIIKIMAKTMLKSQIAKTKGILAVLIILLPLTIVFPWVVGALSCIGVKGDHMACALGGFFLGIFFAVWLFIADIIGIVGVSRRLKALKSASSSPKQKGAIYTVDDKHKRTNVVIIFGLMFLLSFFVFCFFFLF